MCKCRHNVITSFEEACSLRFFIFRCVVSAVDGFANRVVVYATQGDAGLPLPDGGGNRSSPLT